jgi:hypothetical protein
VIALFVGILDSASGDGATEVFAQQAIAGRARRRHGPHYLRVPYVIYRRAILLAPRLLSCIIRPR